jgi:hypothetical protein
MSVQAPPGDGSSVMAAVDDDQFVIADMGNEEAWVSIGSGEAPVLSSWR